MNNKTLISLIIILYSSLTITLAQQKLILKDAETFETLVNVQLIFSLNENMAKYKGGITNEQGEILVPYTANCYYKALFIGYETKTGKITPDKKDATIFLSPSNYEFDQVVVTVSRSLIPIKLSPVITQVIPATRLTQSGFSGIQDALMQEIPGLNFQKVGLGTDINVAGLDVRHILFLIDGDRLTGKMAVNLDYQRFNLHSTDRIEVVKRASSTLYGSRAAGAVINMITKKTKRCFEGKSGLRYGQMNKKNYNKPRKSDFLYIYEKNVDRTNRQTWLSLGSKLGKFTSQTDAWYSSSDAFYLFQSGYDKKNVPANPSIGLMKDTTITSWLARLPLGIEGTEHVKLSQKFYYNPSPNLSVQLYGSLFFLNTYDLIQDLQFSQAKDMTGGAKVNYKIGSFPEATLRIANNKLVRSVQRYWLARR